MDEFISEFEFLKKSLRSGASMGIVTGHTPLSPGLHVSCMTPLGIGDEGLKHPATRRTCMSGSCQLMKKRKYEIRSVTYLTSETGLVLWLLASRFSEVSNPNRLAGRYHSSSPSRSIRDNSERVGDR